MRSVSETTEQTSTSTTSDMCFVDIDALEERVSEFRERYAAAQPFPHIVIDDVLLPDAYAQALGEFTEVADESWKSYLHVNERKYGNTDPETWGPTLQGIGRELTSQRFLSFLEEISGQQNLLADWSMDGGGLHQTHRGGHLNVHADFTAHHTNQNWRRRVNLLLYLNETWQQEWGGDLELWSPDRSRCEASVAPVGNRIAVFTTTEVSYHGHPDPLTCPDDVARRSMALYYFEEQDRPLIKSTDYRARPGDGLKAVPIYLDRQLVRGYDIAKRRLNLPDDFASRILDRLNRIRPQKSAD